MLPQPFRWGVYQCPHKRFPQYCRYHITWGGVLLLTVIFNPCHGLLLAWHMQDASLNEVEDAGGICGMEVMLHYTHTESELCHCVSCIYSGLASSASFGITEATLFFFLALFVDFKNISLMCSTGRCHCGCILPLPSCLASGPVVSATSLYQT